MNALVLATKSLLKWEIVSLCLIVFVKSGIFFSCDKVLLRNSVFKQYYNLTALMMKPKAEIYFKIFDLNENLYFRTNENKNFCY